MAPITPVMPNTSAVPPFVLPPAGSGRGGYYQDDGPGTQIPDGLQMTPDPVPRLEPYSTTGNKPYVVFGKTYTPISDSLPFKQRGIGSWYGKKFHGLKTSSGEPYDMFKMTAAHPTLPIPSYARVTNLNNGLQIIVRVNDRGPFHSDRIIDLSYTAALKLGYIGKGSSTLEVERILTDEIDRIASAAKSVAPTSKEVAGANTVSSTTQVLPPLTPPQPSYAAQIRRIDVNIEAMEAREQAENAATVARIFGTIQTPPSTSSALTTVATKSPSEPASSSGFYLQFGAFTQAHNAETVRNNLIKKWATTLPPIEVVEYGLFYRLYSGPFASRTEAAHAAQHTNLAGFSKPIIVQR